MPLKDDVSWVLSVCTHSDYICKNHKKKKKEETTAITEHYMTTSKLAGLYTYQLIGLFM